MLHIIFSIAHKFYKSPNAVGNESVLARLLSLRLVGKTVTVLFVRRCYARDRARKSRETRLLSVWGKNRTIPIPIPTR